MTGAFARRLWTEPDRRLLWKFVYNFGWKGMRAVQRFERRRKRGETFPAFLFLSLTNRCNLACQGCWSTPSDPPMELPPATVDRIIRECKEQGSFFFGLLGGEPLLYKGLFEVLAKHPDCYFLLFTNGTLLTADVARELRRLGNVSPLVSIEGREETGDERRGGRNVWARALQGLEHCRAQRLITGVATSICRSNLGELATDAFVKEMAAHGVHYLWYYLYRPVGPHPAPELALEPDQVLALRRFIVEARRTAPLLIVDAYWDHDGRALCPAAVGLAHHIGPGGDVEPCPPIQLACERVGPGPLKRLFEDSQFLREFRGLAAQRSRGCILMERPDLLWDLAERTGARDSSGRGTVFAELELLEPHPSHHLPGREVPERSWAYRFAKKHWFFGFGAYG